MNKPTPAEIVRVLDDAILCGRKGSAVNAKLSVLRAKLIGLPPKEPHLLLQLKAGQWPIAIQHDERRELLEYVGYLEEKARCF